MTGEREGQYCSGSAGFCGGGGGGYWVVRG